MTIIRAIIFTILVPCTIAIYIPRWLAQSYPTQIEVEVLRYVGLPLMLVGFLFYLFSAIAFVVKGGGTPAIWFTKPVSFLIGEEPGTLVSQGLYRFTRNPMYVGVVGVVLGEALWFEKEVLFFYVILLWLLFHLVIVFIEEPHLKMKMGEEYEQYLNSVPRWMGRRSFIDRHHL